MSTRFHGWEHNETTSDLVSTASEWGTVYHTLVTHSGGPLYPTTLKQGGVGNFLSGRTGKVFTITKTR